MGSCASGEVPALPVASRGVEHKRGDNVCGQSMCGLVGGCGFLHQARFLSPRIARCQQCWVGGLGGWVGGLGERVSGWMGVSGLLNIAERLSWEKRAADATGSRYNATYRYEQKSEADTRHLSGILWVLTLVGLLQPVHSEAIRLPDPLPKLAEL